MGGNKGDSGMTELAVSTLTIMTFLTVSNGTTLVIARSNLGKTTRCVWNSNNADIDNHRFAMQQLCKERGYNGTFSCGEVDSTYIWTLIEPAAKCRVKNNLKLRG